MSVLDLTVLIATLTLTSVAIQTPRIAAAAVARRDTGEHQGTATEGGRFLELAKSILLYAFTCALAAGAYGLGQWLETHGWAVVGKGASGGAFLTACFLVATPLMVAAESRFSSPMALQTRPALGASLEPSPNQRGLRALKRAAAALVSIVWFPLLGLFLLTALTIFTAGLIWQVVWLPIQFWQLAGGVPIPQAVKTVLLGTAFFAGFCYVIRAGVREVRSWIAALRNAAPAASSGSLRELLWRKCDATSTALVLPAALATILAVCWLSAQALAGRAIHF